MLKIRDALTAVIAENPLLQFGLSHKLLNLSQLAKFLRPLVEARVKKDVTDTSLLMHLSRLQRTMKKIAPQRDQFRIRNIVVNGDLCAFTFTKTAETQRDVLKLFARLQEHEGYITISEGTREISLIIEQSFLPTMEKMITAKPRFSARHLSAVGVQFDEEYAATPGLLYALIQQIALQHVNIIEISSTYTELVFYINDVDTKLAFETIYRTLLKPR